MSATDTEYKEIKSDLRDLKICQRQYFFVSVSGSGAILALARYSEDYAGFVMLAALILVLPCWRMFFDKASSVTRTTGYILYLESQMRSGNSVFVGYEHAVMEFRKLDDSGKFDNLPIFTDPTMPQKGHRHGYWAINFWTYMLICVACLVSAAEWASFSSVSIAIDNQLLFWYSFVVALVAFFWIAITTLYSYKVLRRGKHSYIGMHQSWNEVLDFESGGLKNSHNYLSTAAIT